MAVGASFREPGAESIDIPDVIREWVAEHGLDAGDPDDWLGVTLASEAGEITGEIAYRDGAVSEADGKAFAAGLCEHP